MTAANCPVTATEVWNSAASSTRSGLSINQTVRTRNTAADSKTSSRMGDERCATMRVTPPVVGMRTSPFSMETTVASALMIGQTCLDLLMVAHLLGHPESQIVLQTILPRTDARDAVRESNLAIRELAAERDVQVLDLHAAFDDGTGALRAAETTDGVHLAPAGYRRWAAQLEQALQALPSV